MRFGTIGLLFIAIAWLMPMRAPARALAVGVNVVNPMRASVADQDALLSQLKAAQVQIIRCAISDDANGIGFARRAAALNIRIQLIVSPQFPPSAPSRAYQPNAFPEMWGGHPLSLANPALSKSAFQHLFNDLDANGVALAGIELGNEINWAAFNPDFTLPGEGKVLTLRDLAHDPEGQQIAKGFFQYVRILKVLKNVRDHSRLNRSAMIISAGLVGAKDGESLDDNKREDKVSLAATLAFLRHLGLDSLVDAYGIHSYPSFVRPGDPVAAAARANRLNSVDLGQCRARGATGGKPCWITEWGFPNTDLSCPSNEADRILFVKELRRDFAAAGHRLAGIDYFAWNSDPWARQVDFYSVYRCGALTESGYLAIAPQH